MKDTFVKVAKLCSVPCHLQTLGVAFPYLPVSASERRDGEQGSSQAAFTEGGLWNPALCFCFVVF